MWLDFSGKCIKLHQHAAFLKYESLVLAGILDSLSLFTYFRQVASCFRSLCFIGWQLGLAALICLETFKHFSPLEKWGSSSQVCQPCEVEPVKCHSSIYRNDQILDPDWCCAAVLWGILHCLRTRPKLSCVCSFAHGRNCSIDCGHFDDTTSSIGR